MAANASTTIEYRPAIDGLRAVAVLAVCLFHLNRKWLPGGFVGVDVFFVISGYLIASIILRDCQRERFSFARFYQRRIARLLPAFLTVALATTFAALFIYSPQDLASTGASLSAAAACVANLRLLLQANYFVLSPDAQPFLHCWSLSVEEQFYLIFPATFLVLYRYANARRTQILAALFAVSFFACVGLTYTRPEWAFYLLLTRAWELLAGAILATWKIQELAKSKVLDWLPTGGLVLIVLSFFVVSEGKAFPGYLAALPVAGTACFLIPYDHSRNVAEHLLSWNPLVVIGRMSYSLYLWHWPVFSLVDYEFYGASSLFRLVMKVLITSAATIVCFAFIEKPGRAFLNDPNRRQLAHSVLCRSLAVLILLGLFVMSTNYIDADMGDIAKGGLRFNSSAANGSIILMGDSNGSMYGKMAKDLAKQLGLRLSVISVASGDPLPHSSGQQSPLWLASLATVQKEKPKFLMLVCDWGKLIDDKDRLGIAIEELQPFTRLIILITKPPELPKQASREGIRNGNRPPFFEEPMERAARLSANQVVKNFERENIAVVDIDLLFSDNAGALRFADARGNQLYQDNGHLSVAGANLVEPELIKIITARRSNL
jgi:peptidoglycan/LPS O-acetylase OafA/YrhL